MWPTDSRDSADWELSKENVQPLRQGRRVDVLNTSLQSGGDEQMAQKVAEQRRTFELEIRTYSGDDPLSPWYKYVQWTEQHCPRGGHDGNLDRLLTQCTAKFFTDTRYHQDPRYVALLIKQALGCQQTLEMFKTMFTRHIGTQLTMFYTSWSSQLELTGNLLRADTVLAEGERLGAQPAEELAEARRKLQARVASAVAAGQIQSPAAQIGRGPAAEERRALGALRGSADGAVPRQRVGSVQSGRPGTLATAAAAAPAHTGNQRLQVFVDENAAQPAGPSAAPAHEAAELPVARAVHKENVRKAGPWGAPQKASKRPAPVSTAVPAFRVYEETGANGAHGSPITANPAALAPRAAPAAAPATAEWNPPVAHFEPPNDKVKAMYCKDVIYAGAGEVSFEELRGAKWKKENRLLLEQRRMNEEVQRAMQELVRKNEMLERQVLELKARPPSAGQLQVSLGSSAQLGLSNISTGSSSLAGHSNLSGSNVPASPTVNTRDAMNCVREMFNNTMDTSVQLPRLNNHAGRLAAPAPFSVYEEPEPCVAGSQPSGGYKQPPAAAAAAAASEQLKPAAPVAAAPFAVFEDDAAPAPPDAAKEEESDSDRENRPPADCQPPPPRRRPTSVLTDAVDVPTEPLEEEAPPPAARRPLHFDEELTGFVPLSTDVSFAAGDLSQFAAAAGRVASTPFVRPPPPPPPAVAGAAHGKVEEEGDFTASLKNVRFSRPSGDRTSPAEGGALTPIMEHSRERFKSSSSSSGSDVSRQSRGDVSVPMSAQPWHHRSAAGEATHHSTRDFSAAGRAPLPLLTQSSGYLADRSGSVRPVPVAAAVAAAADCSMSRRPDPADVSDVLPPDVSMARPAASPNSSALRPAEISEKAANLSLAPAGAQLSPAQPPTELSALQPPTELSALQPPTELSALQPPTELSALQPPTELSALQPPTELSVSSAGLAPAAEPCAALSALSLQDPPDPWDAELVTGLLAGLTPPVSARERYRRLNGKLPSFTHKEVVLDGRRMSVTLIGEGAYARVYHAVDRESGQACCLKVQPDGGDWEFYMLDELRERLTRRLGHQPSFLMPVDQVAVYDNGSVLCTEYQPAGSLLDVHNKLRSTHGKFHENLAMLLTAEMLGAVAAVHRVGIIHGDVKPDNFLLRDSQLQDIEELVNCLKDSDQPQLLQLIDFGRAIDMTLLPPGTVFTRVVATDGFTCPEMKDGRPWTYQTDLYGVAASAHVLLFGSYLKLTKRPGPPARWAISGAIKRFWSSTWSEFFTAFLNIDSCTALPDLAAWRRRFLEEALGSRDLTQCLRGLVVSLKQR